MKERTYSKYIFFILVLLSVCSIWSIYRDPDYNLSKKIIFICLNFTYLFLVADYIDIIIYRNILMHVFEYKMYFPSTIYNLYNTILPSISMLLYVFAWILYLSDSIFDLQTVGILILMSESCICYSIFGKKNIIFGNKDNLAINFRLVPYNSIRTYNLSKKRGIGRNINEIIIHLHSGEDITFSVNSIYLDEIIKNLS
jgi:hypothetical protein